MHKLKAKKKKDFSQVEVEIAHTVAVGFFNTPSSHLSPSADPSAFDFSFLILPDVISNNIPVLFFIEYSKFSFSSHIVSLYSFY